MSQSIGILGAGQMGSGIAQVAAASGYDVVLYDLSGAATSKAMQVISSSCDRLIKKETMSSAQKEGLLGRIKPSSQFADLKDCNMAIEAVTENEAVKLEIFRKLDDALRADAILASNTSSISITKIASVTKRPDRVVGMHFMNPVPLMKLVEGIRGLQTSQETFSATKSIAEKMGKVFIEARDFPGFVVNRILMPMINEAIYTLFEGVAQPEAIDNAMKLGTNQPMGPLTLADFIGLDTCLAIMNVLHEGLGDGKYRPCPLLIKYVEAGWLGKKTGRGFYIYDGAR